MSPTASKMLRNFIAPILCLTFLLYAPLRLGSTAAPSPFDLKSAAQYKTEASRYETAIRAIAGLTTMKLETESDLKAAIAILDRERPNLRFHRSKLVNIAVNDPTFSSAVKKRAPDLKTAEAFLKKLSADPTSVLKIEGAEALKTSLVRGDQNDAGILKRAGERLKEATEKIKQQTRAAHATTVRKNITYPNSRAITQPEVPPTAPTLHLQSGMEIVFAICLAVIVIEVAALGAIAVKNISTEEGRDVVAECQERADDRYLRCITDANPFQQGVCYATWLADQSTCLVSPESIK